MPFPPSCVKIDTETEKLPRASQSVKEAEVAEFLLNCRDHSMQGRSSRDEAYLCSANPKDGAMGNNWHIRRWFPVLRGKDKVSCS